MNKFLLIVSLAAMCGCVNCYTRWPTTDMLCASEPSNAVTSVSVDYENGDIRVEYADGHRLIQRFTPPATNETRYAVKGVRTATGGGK